MCGTSGHFELHIFMWKVHPRLFSQYLYHATLACVNTLQGSVPSQNISIVQYFNISLFQYFTIFLSCNSAKCQHTVQRSVLSAPKIFQYFNISLFQYFTIFISCNSAKCQHSATLCAVCAQNISIF